MDHCIFDDSAHSKFSPLKRPSNNFNSGLKSTGSQKYDGYMMKYEVSCFLKATAGNSIQSGKISMPKIRNFHGQKLAVFLSVDWLIRRRHDSCQGDRFAPKL